MSEVLALIKETPGAEFQDIVGKKHPKVRWRYKGKRMLVTVPRTASDYRAIKNATSMLRRQMREIDSASD